jgi:hypothetical protein
MWVRIYLPAISADHRPRRPILAGSSAGCHDAFDGGIRLAQIPYRVYGRRQKQRIQIGIHRADALILLS